MLFSPFVIELLRERSGCPLRVSADCEQLALDIASATNEHIGVNTLKRLLGFIADERSPRTSTLDVIARYLGYEHWDALRIYDEQTENSAFDDRDEYLTCFFKPGQMVYVSYLPNRTVEMEYLGNSRFRVQFNTQHSTFNTQHSTFNTQHSTFTILISLSKLF